MLIPRRAELGPQDMASILWSMADTRFHHKALVEEFVRSLSFRAGIKSLVTAMLALDRLGLPGDSLRTPFLQHLSGQCHELSFGDLRRVLMALARCRAQRGVQDEQLQEICDAIDEKAWDCDPRDLITIPQHLGRLQFVHCQLLARSTDAVSRMISSRLSVVPLDVLRALDGLLLLALLLKKKRLGLGGSCANRGGLEDGGFEDGHAESRAESQCIILAKKCRLLAQRLLGNSSWADLWGLGSQLLGSEILQEEVWELWISEVAKRKWEASQKESRSQRLQHLRRQMIAKWNLQSLPEDLELALSRAVTEW